ncbi:MAG: hypothetical protein R3324_04040 [Halobacteriales archaeon]|nr:hypothetical protein [Halobacteriales archaeon]
MADDRGTVWVVPTTGGECEHPPGEVRYLGDDGSNGYFRCRLCEAVLISRIGG